MRYEPEFPRVIPHPRAGYPRVTHPFAAGLALAGRLARLPCVKHAAGVHAEPGSNSPVFYLLPLPTASTVNLIHDTSLNDCCYSEALVSGTSVFIVFL